jgi:hypothetical protein
LRTTAFASREELADALQALFIAELMDPSTPLWIVTPWISDVVVVDNRAARFTGLLPDMPRRPIRLAETLLAQLQRGGTVVVACRPDDHNRTFTEQLGERASEAGVGDRLLCQFAEHLHEKGVLTRHLLLSGSMNLTYNGLRRLEESILLTDDDNSVARARHAYEDRWGQP